MEQTEEQLSPQTEAPESAEKKRKKGKWRTWWQNHKPTKRRLIQVYVALLTNANLKGFATGRIYSGATKGICTPGLNCYSCPGAVAACPLGALQNAFAQSGTRAPFFVLGIILLLGLLFARMVCGFFCPVGLGQELLYKIKTPKLKKSKATRILSYLKYVILAVFVIAIPLIYGIVDQTAIPAFCKYICPAGTFGGAVMLLANPNNADMYGMLGGLFTWKFAVLAAVVVASIFIFRFFCRFLCPLGAIYGFFNRIALLGIKLDRNKCTDCGLCVSHCKMDIRRVGDHECINCGECIDVCPAKAISWKGSKLFLHENAVPVPAPVSEERPLSAMLRTAPQTSAEGNGEAPQTVSEGTAAAAVPKKHGRNFWLRVGAWTAALALLAGALVYYNFFDVSAAAASGKEYTFTVGSASADQTVSFRVDSLEENAAEAKEIHILSGEGTQLSPYQLSDMVGIYSVEVPWEDGEAQPVWYRFTVEGERKYQVTSLSGDLALEVFYYNAAGAAVPVYRFGEETAFTLTPYGNQVGDECFDFTLPLYNEGGNFTLSEHRGKIVVINFWATWCGPCVMELPEFERIAEEYADKVDIVAVHSARVTEDVQNYLDTKKDEYDPTRTWSDWKLAFAQDAGSEFESVTFSLLGGKDSYPVTVVVDSEGIVRQVRQGSTSYDMLHTWIELLLLSASD